MNFIKFNNETERLNNLRKECGNMSETINQIEQNDFLKTVTMEVYDGVLANLIIRKSTSFRTYNSESESGNNS